MKLFWLSPGSSWLILLSPALQGEIQQGRHPQVSDHGDLISLLPLLCVVLVGSGALALWLEHPHGALLRALSAPGRAAAALRRCPLNPNHMDILQHGTLPLAKLFWT